MKSFILAALVTVLPTPAHADNLDIFGVWLTEAGDAHIEITDCGNGTPCGSLIWVDLTTSPTDRDAQNPDSELRNRPLVGVPIIWGYEARRKEWRKGKIYNPEDGKTFRSSVRRLENGTLEVKGCLGPVCRSNIWTPVLNAELEP